VLLSKRPWNLLSFGIASSTDEVRTLAQSELRTMLGYSQPLTMVPTARYVLFDEHG
jgi:hypothetical protein